MEDLREEVEYWKKKYHEERKKPKEDIRTDNIKDEKKVKVELKPKKEEYREEQNDHHEVIDID